MNIQREIGDLVVDKKDKKISSFFKRLLSGIVLLALLSFVIYIGGDVLWFFSFVVSIIALFELYKVFKIEKNRLGILGYLLVSIYYIMISQFKVDGILFFIILMVLLLLIFYIFSFPLFSIKDVALTLFGIFYVAVLFSFIYLIRVQRGVYGKYLVWVIFISSWGCDTFAYCVGMLCGRHKLNNVLSPNKTIEGCIGGVIGSVVLGLIYTYVLLNNIVNNIEISLIRVGCACFICSIISQLGDLVASAIKREYKIKDYGDIIPGHGGILDRFDSVIFCAPVLYFLLNVYR